MSFFQAGYLMGDYLTQRLKDSGADFDAIVASFVDDVSPRAAMAASREISDWFGHAADDEDLHDLYLDGGGNYAPDPTVWTLRQCLAHVVRILEARRDAFLEEAEREVGWLPAGTVHSVVEWGGAFGLDWLRRLPDLIKELEKDWDLKPPRVPFRSPSGYVAGVSSSDGSAAVLKVTHSAASEASALEAFGGRGMVRLLRFSPAAGAILIERALPGRPLSEWVATDDVRATEVAAGLLQKLWRSAPEGQPETLTDYRVRFRGLDSLRHHFENYRHFLGDRGPIPLALVIDAGRILQELLASAPEQPTILHGDLHHDNIVSSDRAPGGWLAIDPKGWVGDPGYDVGALLYNPLGYVADVGDLTGLLDRRLRQLSEQLEMDEQRLRAWGFVKAVASEVWFVEDDGATHGVPLRVAETLRNRL
jgi:streptomycin 6-kinase